MSKIICDVCGTSYPETSTQCPICGCVRPVDVLTVNTDNSQKDESATGTYTYVKGGRFSKSNVRKRNSANHNTVVEEDSDFSVATDLQQEKGDKGLIVAICILLLAIVAVVIYIALHFFAPDQTQGNVYDPDNNFTTPTNNENATTKPTELVVPCVKVSLSNTVVELDKTGAAYLLNVTVDPVNTTDAIVFSSSNEMVATVTDAGKIVAVGSGQATITVSCGSARAECTVSCNFESGKTDPTNPTDGPTTPTDSFKLNREDFTLNNKGQVWKLYDGDIPVKEITWTSDDEKVATIKDGIVTAVGTGRTTVYAEYNGTKLSCTVRCAASVGKYVESTDSTESVEEYSISKTDVTLRLSGSKSFQLTLMDEQRNVVDVVWTVADGTICSVEGNTVTGLSTGTTTVSVTYNGKSYSCIVRVLES